MVPKAFIEVHASKEKVYAVLTDFKSYPEWCPFTRRLKGQLVEGAQLDMEVEMSAGSPLRHQRVTVAELTSGEKIVWTYTLLPWAPWLLHAVRAQRLSESPSNPGSATIYSTTDTMTGLLSPLVLFLYGASVQKGFECIARALKQRAEA